MVWNPCDLLRDFQQVAELLAAHEHASATERCERVASYFSDTYGADQGPRHFRQFVRICLYIHHHADELRACGLLSQDGTAPDPTFLYALLTAVEDGEGTSGEASRGTLAAVPAREVPEDKVEP